MTRRLVQLGVMAVMVPSDVHGVACCLSDHRSGVIFAVVVVCQQKQQWQLQQKECSRVGGLLYNMQDPIGVEATFAKKV